MKEQVVSLSIKISNDILLGTVVDIVRSGKLVKINITGSSMHPFLQHGDTVILRGIKLKEIKKGDIILGKYKHSYVLHRVIGKRKHCIYIAGDNNLRLVETIDNSEIYAQAVTLVKPSGDVDLTSIYNRYLGISWYYLRPFRWLYIKFFK